MYVKIEIIIYGINRDKFFWVEMIEINFFVFSSYMIRSVYNVYCMFYFVYLYIVVYKFCFEEY